MSMAGRGSVRKGAETQVAVHRDEGECAGKRMGVMIVTVTAMSFVSSSRMSWKQRWHWTIFVEPVTVGVEQYFSPSLGARSDW
mgnify:CR=1 FL=1